MTTRPDKKRVPWAMYDPVTGEVVATGICSKKNVQSQPMVRGGSYATIETPRLADARDDEIVEVDGRRQLRRKQRQQVRGEP